MLSPVSHLNGIEATCILFPYIDVVYKPTWTPPDERLHLNATLLQYSEPPVN